VRVVGAVGKRWLHVVARYAPLPPAARASLHRRRGVRVGHRVSSVTLEDDVTVIAQTTILGHTYYPRHFYPLLGDETTRAGLRTTIRRGAYLGLRSTVVTADVAPYTMVAGVPARVVREFGPDEVGSDLVG